MKKLIISSIVVGVLASGAYASKVEKVINLGALYNDRILVDGAQVGGILGFHFHRIFDNSVLFGTHLAICA